MEMETGMGMGMGMTPCIAYTMLQKPMFEKAEKNTKGMCPRVRLKRDY
jgi:hypothetical protein